MGATPMQTVIGRLEQSGKQPKQRGDKYEARCPAHEDNNPSLSIAPGTEPDQVLMHCHAGCNIEDITAALGLEPKDLYAPKTRTGELTEIEHYTYTDELGNPLMRVHRFHPKTFRQSHYNGHTWQWGAKDVPPTLYRLPQIVQAIANCTTIYIVEGERDVHTLEQLGHTATTNAGGAGKFKPEHAQQLVGAAKVVIIADNDTPGHKHAEQVAAELNWAGITHCVMLPAPGCKDISDHLAAGHALTELQDYTAADTETPVEAAEIDADDIGHGWEPTDLTEILNGTYEPPVPTIGKRTDGAGLFYAGRINALFGESGSGKSWIAMAACAQEIMAGNHVIYIDHEDHATSVTQRILKLGCARNLVLEQLHYIRPQRGWNQLAKIDVSALITETAATLVVCDSTGEGMSLDTIDPNSDDQVARWMRDFGRHLADLGPALLLLDHMAKSSESNKAFMIGSQRKKAAIDGAAYRVDVGIAPSKGIDGALNLVTAKDRGGYYQHGAKVADITISDTDTGIDVTIKPPSNGLPTVLMGRISEYIATIGPCSTNSIQQHVEGNSKSLRNALQKLVDLGYVARNVKTGVGGGFVHTNIKPFNELDLFATTATTATTASEVGPDPLNATATTATNRVPDEVVEPPKFTSTTSTTSLLVVEGGRGQNNQTTTPHQPRPDII
jgi:hypothetical protein